MKEVFSARHVAVGSTTLAFKYVKHASIKQQHTQTSHMHGSTAVLLRSSKDIRANHSKPHRVLGVQFVAIVLVRTLLRNLYYSLRSTNTLEQYRDKQLHYKTV